MYVRSRGGMKLRRQFPEWLIRGCCAALPRCVCAIEVELKVEVQFFLGECSHFTQYRIS